MLTLERKAAPVQTHPEGSLVEPDAYLLASKTASPKSPQAITQVDAVARSPSPVSSPAAVNESPVPYPQHSGQEQLRKVAPPPEQQPQRSAVPPQQASRGIDLEPPKRRNLENPPRNNKVDGPVHSFNIRIVSGSELFSASPDPDLISSTIVSVPAP